MDSTRFDTVSLRALPEGRAIRRVLAAALAAVDPYAAVKRWLRREGDRLALGETGYNLAHFRRVWLVGAGKAGFPMAQAAVEVLGERLSGGLVIVKEGHAPEDRGSEGRGLSGVEIVQAGHPLPDRRGVEATQRLTGMLREAGADDLVVCLISGGGSALMTAPAEGISLDELQQMTAELLACGATINQINCLRKHVDLVKGGGLAGLAAPAALITLVLSDVVGDPLDVIASGPATPDESTFAAAWGVLELYGLTDRIPLSIRARLQAGMRGEVPETPKPGDPLFKWVQNQVVSSNIQAAQAALDQARAEGWNALLLTTFLQGEARQAGRMLAAVARQAAASGEPLARPACILAGGETTVTLRGKGLGGRNQELALGAVTELAGLPGVTLAALATDGGDGPTDAAGAVVTGETLARARLLGLDPTDYLARNDAYHFFEPLGDLLRPGPTQTNVNDLAFLFVL